MPKQSPADALAPLGFRPYHTGGGCMVYRAVYNDRSECWITEGDDARLPESMQSPVLVGCYVAMADGELSNDGIMFVYPSLADALPMLAARAHVQFIQWEG